MEVMMSGFYGYFEALQENNQFYDSYFNQIADNNSIFFSDLEDY